MKNLTTFLKKRWPLIVSIVVILVALPLAYVFSGKMNTELRESREREATNLLNQLEGLKVTYDLPAPVEGMEAVDRSGVMPHEDLTEWFRTQQQAQNEKLDQAIRSIVEFNGKGRGVLVDGLFPIEPENESEAQLLRLRMQELLIPSDGDSVYEQLIAGLNATTPPDPQRVLDTLDDTRARLFEREEAQSGESAFEPEELEAMTQELTAQRVSLYARPAQEHSIYLSLEQFPEGSPFDVAPAFPREAVSGTPGFGLTFLWQLDYWLAQDIVGFLKEANSRDDRLLSIVDAPIKRVLSIRGEPLRLDRTRSRGEFDDGPIDAGPDPSVQVIEARYHASPTGREADWLNQLYDIRRVRISLVVDSARIPEILDAAKRANIIEETDLDISAVDVWRDLELGYYYGQDHVVQLDLELQFYYLRAWTAPLKPNMIRQELGLDFHPDPADDEGFEQDPGLG